MNKKIKDLLSFCEVKTLRSAISSPIKLHSVLLEIDFDEQIHFPLIWMFLHYADLYRAAGLLAKCPKDNELYLALNDYYQALEVASYGISVFPLTVPWRNWWSGPHLDFPKELNGKSLTKWCPGRVRYKDNSIAFVMLGEQYHDTIRFLDCEFPAEPFPEEDSLIEVAFFGEEFLVRTHELKHWQPFPDLRSEIQPIIDDLENSLKQWS